MVTIVAELDYDFNDDPHKDCDEAACTDPCHDLQHALVHERHAECQCTRCTADCEHVLGAVHRGQVNLLDVWHILDAANQSSRAAKESVGTRCIHNCMPLSLLDG